MGSVQSKIRRVLKKKSKKSSSGNDPRKTPPHGSPPIHTPGVEPTQAQVNTTIQDTRPRTNLPQGPPSVLVPEQPNSAQHQVNTTYQVTGHVLREPEVPSGPADTADATYRPILPPQPTYAAHPSSFETERETPWLQHHALGISDGDLATHPEGEMDKIKRRSTVLSLEIVDAEKARNSRLWGEAIERLKQKQEFQGIIDFERGTKPVERLLQEVESRRAIIETQRICYRNSQGEDVPVSDVIFRELNNYAAIGDVALQHHPDVVALVWSGFRLLLQVGTSYVDNLAMILNSVGYLAWIICCGALYEELYVKMDAKCSDDIRDCLVSQYVSILTYLSLANEHLKGSKTERIFESLSPQLSQLLDEIRDSERMIKERSDMAEKEVANMERSKQEESRRKLKYIREHLGNVRSAVNECNTKLSKLCKIADETTFHNTLDWVCNIQYGKIHEDHKTKRTADTCLWLEQNSIFQDWVNCRSSSAVLWLRGAAGTGKTILASSVIDLLDDKYKRNRSLAYFYCSITSPNRTLPESVLRAITKQLCHAYSGGRLKLPKQLVEIKGKRVRESAGLPSLEECTNLIIELSNHLSSGVWIVIDALDECDSATRKELFSSLDKIVTAGKDIRIFLTGRDEADIRGYMIQRHENYLIDPRDNASDIELYIKSELGKLYEALRFREVEPELVTQVKSLEEEHIKSLKGNAHGMFLSVHHRMEALRVETTIHGMQRAIDDFPTSLNAVYTDILDRINRQGDTDSTSAHEILKWLFYAVDDFSANTILEALRHSASVKGSGNAKPKARAVRNAQNICCGLVIHDEKTGALRFSHATVKEYLGMLNGPGSCISEGHEFMSDICFRIIASSNYCMDEQCTDDTSSRAFISYATRNWGNHVRHCESRDSCQDFLKTSSPSYKAWASKAVETIPTLRMKEPPGCCVDLVWVACYYRLLKTLRANLETIGAGCVNAAGRTPLHHCAEHGYLEFVECLVEYKAIDVNAEDDMKRTPLLLAISSNQVDVVEALLKHPGLKIDVVDQGGKTALMHACLMGSDKTVQLLLDSTEFDVNIADAEGCSALHHATLKGHESILDLLLRVSSLNINSQEECGSTALSLAAKSGDVAVVVKLLSFQANSGPALDPNLTNNNGETPLCIAAENDQQKIAAILIEDQRVDINCGTPSGPGDNLFIKAAERNTSWLVKLLVAREDLDINRRGIGDWTALRNTIYGHAFDAFKYIIAAPGVDIECKHEPETLLHVAIRGGHSSMVSELLAHGADASAADESGQTPLIAAASRGDVDTFQVLLAHYDKVQPQDRPAQLLGTAVSGNAQIAQLIQDHKGYNINQRNGSGKTELMIAAANGLTNIVQSLLRRHAIEVNAVDDEGESALSLAILKGHGSVVEALVGYPDVEIKLPASRGTALPQWAFGCTDGKVLEVILRCYPALEGAMDVDGKQFISLIPAASSNNTGIMQHLLAHGYNVNDTDGAGKTALVEAATKGHKEPVRILLREEAIDINQIDSKGKSALLHAVKHGHTEVAQILLGTNEIDITLTNHKGRSALFVAAANGHIEIVQMLLTMDGSDINQADSRDKSALICAAENGHNQVVQELLGKKGIDVNLVDNGARSALLHATENGHIEIVQALLKMDGIDINQVNYGGEHALICAAVKGLTQMVQALLENKGIDVNLVDNGARSALLHATENGHIEIVQALLKMDGIDINQVNCWGKSALICAAENGHTQMVQVLLEKKGIDVNLVDHGERSALPHATENGHTEVAQILLGTDGIDITLTNHKGRSALPGAAGNGHIEIVQMLLAVDGIDINQVDSRGKSALIRAAQNGHTQVVQVLLGREGIDVNIVDSQGQCALWHASSCGYIGVLTSLLEHTQIDIKNRSSDGSTPLLTSAEHGHLEVFQHLFKRYEVDQLQEMTEEKNTVLSFAAGRGDTRMVQMILDSGVYDINHRNVYGSTPIFRAAFWGHAECVAMLLDVDGVDPGILHNDGDSALDSAKRMGHEEVIKLLELRVGAKEK